MSHGSEQACDRPCGHLQTPFRCDILDTMSSALRIATPILLLLAIGCDAGRAKHSPAPPEVVLAAAASLQDAVEALTPLVQAADLELVTNFAGSNVLAQQIDAAPVADVFISADRGWIDSLRERGRLRATAPLPLLSNQLVIIGHADELKVPPGIDRLHGLELLAREPPELLVLADPQAVPAGRYARQLLESVTLADGSTLWERLATRVVPTADVRAALAMVEARTDAYGIVYATDAARLRHGRVLFTAPDAQAPEIRYFGAAVADRKHPELADRLLAVLASPAATTIFQQHGFLASPPAHATPVPPPPDATN